MTRRSLWTAILSLLGLRAPAATLGISTHSTDVAQLDAMRSAGYTVVRTDLVYWKVHRPGVHDSATFDWTEYDRWYAALRSRGMTPVWILGFRTGYDPPRGLSELGEYGAYVAGAVRRYPGSVWEVWNEPNTTRFWPSRNAQEYVQLLRATAAIVRGTDPTARVVSGGMGGAVFDWAWFSRFVLSGGLDHVDAFGLHPYCVSEPENLRALVGEVRASMFPREVPIVITEWGWERDAQQVERIARGVAQADRSEVDLAVFYSWDDADGERFGVDPSLRDR